MDHINTQLNGLVAAPESTATEIARLQKLDGNAAATRIEELTTDMRQQSTALDELVKTSITS